MVCYTCSLPKAGRTLSKAPFLPILIIKSAIRGRLLLTKKTLTLHFTI